MEYVNPASKACMHAWECCDVHAHTCMHACAQAWRVYQRGLERWIIDLLQPVFDGLVKDGAVPRFVQRWGAGACLAFCGRAAKGLGA